MKFSKLEQEQIKKLCEWAGEANQFKPVREYYNNVCLEDGHGIICFSEGHQDGTCAILCVKKDLLTKDPAIIFDLENYYIFTFSLFQKLERLGLITLSEGKYDSNKEFSWVCFGGNTVALNLRKVNDSYVFDYLSKHSGHKTVELDKSFNLSFFNTEKNSEESFEYTTHILSGKYDVFNVMMSLLSIDQELFELVSNGFKTYEDIQLEEAQKQTKAAHESLKEAQKQTKWSIRAFVLSVLAIIASIIVPQCVESTINQNQFDTLKILQKELNEGMKDLKNKQIDKDSAIKLLNLTNKSIDEISNTLKEVKELKSK